MNEKSNAILDALRELAAGETDDKEKRMYMETIKILIGPGDELQSDLFQCNECNKCMVVDGEKVCRSGCLTAADCKKKFRPIKKTKKRGSK